MEGINHDDPVFADMGTELRTLDTKYRLEEKLEIEDRLASGETMSEYDSTPKSSVTLFTDYKTEDADPIPIFNINPNYVYSNKIDGSMNYSQNQLTTQIIEAENNTRQLEFDQPTTVTFKINADHYNSILRDFKLIFALPDIYSFLIPAGYMYNLETFSSDFRWIENIGTTLMSKISVTVGNFTEEYTGENIRTMILRDLSETHKINAFNEDIGNVPELYLPEEYENNYPHVVPPMESDYDNNNPADLNMTHYRSFSSIRARNLIVPLKPFFDRGTQIGLPTFMWQNKNTNISITITFRPISDLYTVRDIEDPDNNYPRIKPSELKVATRMKLFTSFPRIDVLKALGNRTLNSALYNKNDFGKFRFRYQLCFNQIDIGIDERLEYMKRLTESEIKIPITRYINYDNFKHIDFREKFTTKQNEMPIGGKRVLSVTLYPQRDDVDKTNQWTNYTTRNEKYNKIKLIYPISQLEETIKDPKYFTYDGIHLNKERAIVDESYDPTVPKTSLLYYPSSRGLVDVWTRRQARIEIVRQFSLSVDNIIYIHRDVDYDICRSMFRDRYKGTLDEGVVMIPFSDDLSDRYYASGVGNFKPMKLSSGLIFELKDITQPLFRVVDEVDQSGVCEIEEIKKVVKYDYGYNLSIVVEVQSYISFNSNNIELITEIF